MIGVLMIGRWGQIEWANTHEDQAYRIMVQANTLARQIFSPDDITCYMGLLLTAYGRLLGYKPELRHDVARFQV